MYTYIYEAGQGGDGERTIAIEEGEGRGGKHQSKSQGSDAKERRIKRGEKRVTGMRVMKKMRRMV